jgi:SAM-dependent methyltransferase
MSTSSFRQGSSEKEYVLGTGDDELVRLGFQHSAWRAQAGNIWERAGFAPGQALLDVGCGPGFATLDLARMVGASGHVTAVDVSKRFIEHLESQAAAQGIRNIKTHVCDVSDMSLADVAFDGAYARWVLCFVPDPQVIVEKIANALRPGGRLAVQDYYNYTAIRLAPRSAAFERVIRAVDESWRGHRGDPDVGLRLPEMFRASGLRLVDVRPLVRAARPGTLLWNWPTTFFRNYVPALVGMGLLNAGEQAAFERDWEARSNDPDAMFVSPPMMDLVAVKEA